MYRLLSRHDQSSVPSARFFRIEVDKHSCGRMPMPRSPHSKRYAPDKQSAVPKSLQYLQNGFCAFFKAWTFPLFSTLGSGPISETARRIECALPLAAGLPQT